ncbi:IS4 family transposase [Vibrio breoganii]|uniref:IS4 family transposase n=1 Tax=Vibrio breoganii TaxID=553239 RepID=UPI0021C46F67|nr:IS4 family transposase [Vibrio breoganii]
MFTSNSEHWAEFIFGRAQLGDPRRTNRLVKVASDLAKNAGKSVSRSCDNPASIEGAYRFIRNDSISPEAIAEAGYIQTDELVRQRPLVLALQDTTGLSYRHSVCEELGEVNSGSDRRHSNKGRTLYAHSTLMLDAQSEQVLGLAYQHYWYRESKQVQQTHQLQCRERSEKESYKWQHNVEQLSSRLETLDNVIDVCDREADMYEYLDYQINQGHRFVVRASDNRRLVGFDEKLFTVLDALEPSAHYTIDIQQKGGRRARTATIALSHTSVTLQKPQRAKAEATITVNAVVCQEVEPNGEKGKLRWVLYTTEPVTTPEEARQIARYYELRWRIEEFHKIWKSEGTQVERLRMQSRDNLRRVAVIQAFIAVRLFQLRELTQNKEEAKNIPCTVYFSNVSWKILWKAVHKTKPIPTEPPSLHWGYYALAKLGRWHDSKRNGRVGVVALWDGWLQLMQLVESYEMLKGLDL